MSYNHADNECLSDGGWSTWSEWGSCNKVCGTGLKTRRRSCTNPVPSTGRRNCTGDYTENTNCHVVDCPTGTTVDAPRRSMKVLTGCWLVDGGWGNWAAWLPCTATCGGGSQTRSRPCNNPEPRDGGLNCEGSGTEIKQCYTQSCPCGRFHKAVS